LLIKGPSVPDISFPPGDVGLSSQLDTSSVSTDECVSAEPQVSVPLESLSDDPSLIFSPSSCELTILPPRDAQSKGQVSSFLQCIPSVSEDSFEDCLDSFVSSDRVIPSTLETLGVLVACPPVISSVDSSGHVSLSLSTNFFFFFLTSSSCLLRWFFAPWVTGSVFNFRFNLVVFYLFFFLVP
jgi:hypothetical protein